MTAQAFKDPPIQYRSRPFYWLNGKLESTALREQIQSMRDQCGFGGFAPLAMRSTQPAYLSDGYFEQYGLMLEMAETLGLKMIFYDDIDYPTGSAGGRLAAQYPDSLLKNLRKVEETVAGPNSIERPAPKGRLMAAVAMETRTKQRADLAGFIKDGVLRWDAPGGMEGHVLQLRAGGVILIRQYRYAAEGELWEIPAGTLDAGEPPETCADRELREEAGCVARTMRHLSTIYTTPGFTDERIHLYAATRLTRVPAALEADEFIETHERRWSEVGGMIRRGDIRDGKTLCALMWMQCFGRGW